MNHSFDMKRFNGLARYAAVAKTSALLYMLVPINIIFALVTGFYMMDFPISDVVSQPTTMVWIDFFLGIATFVVGFTIVCMVSVAFLAPVVFTITGPMLFKRILEDTKADTLIETVGAYVRDFYNAGASAVSSSGLSDVSEKYKSHIPVIAFALKRIGFDIEKVSSFASADAAVEKITGELRGAIESKTQSSYWKYALLLLFPWVFIMFVS